MDKSSVPTNHRDLREPWQAALKSQFHPKQITSSIAIATLVRLSSWLRSGQDRTRLVPPLKALTSSNGAQALISNMTLFRKAMLKLKNQNETQIICANEGNKLKVVEKLKLQKIQDTEKSSKPKLYVLKGLFVQKCEEVLPALIEEKIPGSKLTSLSNISNHSVFLVHFVRPTTITLQNLRTIKVQSSKHHPQMGSLRFFSQETDTMQQMRPLQSSSLRMLYASKMHKVSWDPWARQLCPKNSRPGRYTEMRNLTGKSRSKQPQLRTCKSYS